MRRQRLVTVCVVLVVLATGACSDDDGEEAGLATTPPTSTTTTVAATTSTAPATTVTTARATTTTARVTAANAVIEPDSIGGLEPGSNKTAASTRFGDPTSTGDGTDLAGDRYEFLRWDFSGNRGLTLYYRQRGVTSPLLEHWQVTAAGPATARGVKVGDPASAVVAAYGALQPFCCDAQVASVTRGPGRMIVIVQPGGNVTQIIGGIESSWSRLIAD